MWDATLCRMTTQATTSVRISHRVHRDARRIAYETGVSMASVIELALLDLAEAYDSTRSGDQLTRRVRDLQAVRQARQLPH